MNKRQSDRSLKARASKREFLRVYDNMSLPPRDIVVECSDGQWVRHAWQSVARFGWSRWERAGEGR